MSSLFIISNPSFPHRYSYYLLLDSTLLTRSYPLQIPNPFLITTLNHSPMHTSILTTKSITFLSNSVFPTPTKDTLPLHLSLYFKIYPYPYSFLPTKMIPFPSLAHYFTFRNLLEAHFIQNVECPMKRICSGNYIKVITVHPLAEFDENLNFQIVVLLVLFQNIVYISYGKVLC